MKNWNALEKVNDRFVCKNAIGAVSEFRCRRTSIPKVIALFDYLN